MTDITFTTHVRRPFTVEAIEVTEENIEALAPMIGDLVVSDVEPPYIQVDRKRVSHVYRVRFGWFITKKDEKIHCYSPTVFAKEFTEATQPTLDWVEYLNAPTEDTPVEELPQPEVVDEDDEVVDDTSHEIIN